MNEKLLNSLIKSVNADIIQRIVIMIKKRKAFYTKLEKLERNNKTTSLIGIFSNQIKNKISPEIMQKFDWIFWTKDQSNDTNGPQKFERNLDDEVIEIVERIILGIGAKFAEKIRIIVTEDPLLYGAGVIREKFGIPGFQRPNSWFWIWKNPMRIYLANFESANWYFHSSENQHKEMGVWIRGELKLRLIYSHGSLQKKRELQQLDTDNSCKQFILEEFVCGKEFWASAFLLPNSRVMPHMIVYFGFSMNDVPTNTGMPIKSICRRFEDYGEEFPNMDKFVEKVVKALRPMTCENFVVQGFQLEPNSDQYIFTESAYRQGGPSTAMSYMTTGISTEMAILSMNLLPGFEPTICNNNGLNDGKTMQVEMMKPDPESGCIAFIFRPNSMAFSPRSAAFH